jgi:hypothetical protein
MGFEGELTVGCWFDEVKAIVSCGNRIYSLSIGKYAEIILMAQCDITQLSVQAWTGLIAVSDLSGTVSVLEGSGQIVH